MWYISVAVRPDARSVSASRNDIEALSKE